MEKEVIEKYLCMASAAIKSLVKVQDNSDGLNDKHRFNQAL